MTVYEELIELGYSDEDIRKAAGTHNRSNPRTISLALMETPDDFPIVGLTYDVDYRSEEESGIFHLAKAINSSDNQKAHFIVADNGFTCFTVGTASAKEVQNQALLAAEYHRGALGYVQESAASHLKYSTVAEIRAYAQEHNISLTGLTRKDEMLDAVIANAAMGSPNIWPAWFQLGNMLIFDAHSGIVADTMSILFDAISKNALGVSNSKMVFASGIGFYDTRDIGPKLAQKRKEEKEAYDAAMAALEPVAEELKARGHHWYALGNPSTIRTEGAEKAEIRYWLNGAGVGSLGQPFGWYTLDELLAEKFMDDLRNKRQ